MPGRFPLVAKLHHTLPSCFSSRFLAITISCIALVFAACEDPSNVGIGLVGEDQGGQPDVRVLDLAQFENAPLERPAGSLPRVLAGRVDDPLIGTIEAEGYFDLTSTASSRFRENEVQSATLLLRPTYIYGDTTARATFAVRQINEVWPASGLPPDTVLSTGDVIGEFEFTPTDTLVLVAMPESWIAENDDLIRSSGFVDDFHGFRLEQVSGNAVVGFAGETQLRAFTEADSAVFPVVRSYSAVRRTTSANLPPQRILYQAGSGPLTSLQIDLESEALLNAAINKVALTFQTDTLTLSQKPPNFRRPIITSLDLYGILDDDRLALIDRAEMDSEGRFIFDGASLAGELQRILLGTRSFDRFELRLPVGQGSFGETGTAIVQGSIDVQLFYDTSSVEYAPGGFVTVTPID